MRGGSSRLIKKRSGNLSSCHHSGICDDRWWETPERHTRPCLAVRWVLTHARLSWRLIQHARSGLVFRAITRQCCLFYTCWLNINGALDLIDIETVPRDLRELIRSEAPALATGVSTAEAVIHKAQQASDSSRREPGVGACGGQFTRVAVADSFGQLLPCVCSCVTSSYLPMFISAGMTQQAIWSNLPNANQQVAHRFLPVPVPAARRVLSCLIPPASAAQSRPRMDAWF